MLCEHEACSGGHVITGTAPGPGCWTCGNQAAAAQSLLVGESNLMLLALAAGSRLACTMNARVIVLLPCAGKLLPHGIMAAHFGSQEFPAVHEEQENSCGGSVGVSSPVFRDPGSNVVAFSWSGSSRSLAPTHGRCPGKLYSNFTSLLHVCSVRLLTREILHSLMLSCACAPNAKAASMFDPQIFLKSYLQAIQYTQSSLAPCDL